MSETEGTNDIEAAAAAAADTAAETPPETRADAPPPPPEPTPETKAQPPEPKKVTKAGKGKKPDAATKQIQSHLAARKKAADAIPREPEKEPDESQLAADAAKAEKAAKSDELAAEIAALEAKANQLRDERNELLSSGVVDDGRSHIERVRAAQARSREIREQRVRDRVKLLARGAGKSPLDLAHASAPRKSPADAAEVKTE
jgi:hypothetical protein